MREILNQATFASIIDHAIEAGQVTRKQLAFAAGKDDETIRRWLRDDQLPKLNAFRQLLGDGSLPRVLRDALAAWFSRRTGYVMHAAEETDRTQLDPTGDRIIDARDTLCLSVSAVQQGGAALQVLCVAMKDGKLDEAEKAQVRSILHEHENTVRLALETLDFNDRSAMQLRTA